MNGGYSAPKPSYNAPKPSYSAPSSSYGAPSKPKYNSGQTNPTKPKYKPSYNNANSIGGSSYSAPKPNYSQVGDSNSIIPISTGYSAPTDSYGAPKPSYNAPKPSYNAPKPSYNAPKPSYNAPNLDSYSAPSRPSYNAPKPSYNAPTDSYGSPSRPSYNAPKPSYNAPSSSYGSPEYGVPTGFNRYDDDGNIDYTDGFGERDGIGHHHGKHHGTHHGDHHGDHHGHHGSHHGNHESHHGHGHHGNHHEGHRTGRADECYCVPVNQCPTSSVMPTSGFQDYSALVDPRTLPSGIDSILEHEEADTLDLSLETSLPEDNRARSLKTSIEALDAGEEEKKTSAGDGNDSIDFGELLAEAEKEVDKTASRRRRRDVASEETIETEEQFSDVQGVSDAISIILYF